MKDGPIIPRFLPLNTSSFFGLCASLHCLGGVYFSKLGNDFWQTNVTVTNLCSLREIVG
ncbi:unnamed protein product [Acanthoscelides obtectus]|uniref:Uncharacterized protein n=1 Tax=Acanthoscelides obtectus TaxID=200917 RepID=A0A9P0L3C3_ACAOB|nr:unnamed protein product [Acanthoscelides obtectus]CAK1642301.1 hypothetical protein AOBTE_LOCUS12966 [Acanthoscelides obtectus]